MSNKTTNNWLKKIFSVGTLSLVIAIIGTYISYKTLLSDTGGELKITFTEQASSLYDRSTATIALNENSSDCLNDLLPQFSNPSKYMLKDFYLRYTITGSGIEITPTGFFEKAESRQGSTLTYKTGRLAPGMKTEDAIAGIKFHNRETPLTIEIDASFNGVSEPYHHVCRLTVIHVPVTQGESASAWYSRISRQAGSKDVLSFYSNGESRLIAGTVQAPTVIHTPTPSAATDTPVETTTSQEPENISTTGTTTSTPNKTIKKEKNHTGINVIIIAGMILIIFGIFVCGDLSDAWRETHDHSLSNLKRTFFTESFMIKRANPTGGRKIWANFLWGYAIVGWTIAILALTVFIIAIIYAISTYF